MSHPISGPRHLHQLAESPTCPDPCLNGDSMTQPRGRGGAPSASGWCPLLQQAAAWQLRERPRHSRQQWSPVQEGAARSHLVLLPATNVERKLAQCLCRSGKRCLFFFFPGLTGSPRGLDKTQLPIQYIQYITYYFPSTAWVIYFCEHPKNPKWLLIWQMGKLKFTGTNPLLTCAHTPGFISSL